MITRAQARQNMPQEVQAQQAIRTYVKDQNKNSDNQLTTTQTSVTDLGDKCALQSTVVNPEVKSLLQGNISDLIHAQSTDDTLKQIRKSVTDKSHTIMMFATINKMALL